MSNLRVFFMWTWSSFQLTAADCFWYFQFWLHQRQRRRWKRRVVVEEFVQKREETPSGEISHRPGFSMEF